jgi:hypothetical protein
VGRLLVVPLAIGVFVVGYALLAFWYVALYLLTLIPIPPFVAVHWLLDQAATKGVVAVAIAVLDAVGTANAVAGFLRQKRARNAHQAAPDAPGEP